MLCPALLWSGPCLVLVLVYMGNGYVNFHVESFAVWLCEG